MPYKNEHSCRLEEPIDGAPTRRRNGDREHQGKKYDVIYQQHADHKWHDQAYRYPTRTWTASEARSHCDEHDGEFHPADDNSQSTHRPSQGPAYPLAALLEYVAARAWAMELGTLRQMTNILERHLKGERLSSEQIEQLTGRSANSAGRNEPGLIISDAGVGVIDISGVIAKYSRMVNDVSQPRGTSVELMRTQLRRALTSKRVKSILLRIESPGGYLAGLAEFADEIYLAGREKPVIAFVDDQAESAAYWLASQAHKIYATKTASVGSIGVYTLYVDSSAAAEKMDYKIHIIRSGENKGVGEPGVPITDENLKVLQHKIDSEFEVFLSAVFRGRSAAGLTEKQLRKLADGRSYIGREAVEKQLVDELGGFEQALAWAGNAELDDYVRAAGASADEETIFDFKENKMAKEKEAAGDATELDKVQKEAAKAERDRITAITDALAGDDLAEIRRKAIDSGMGI